MRWGNLNDAEGFEAYKQSKLANLLHMQELSRRYGHPSPAKMLAMCVDPGEVNTDIVRHFPLASLIKPILLLIPERNTPEQGADSVVHCLVCGEEEAAALTGRLVRERKAVDVLGETGTVFSRMVLSVVRCRLKLPFRSCRPHLFHDTLLHLLRSPIFGVTKLDVHEALVLCVVG
mmetsp:Transcript_69235/g.184538  ORF Transcript_69235/g.184538 Transcript_69235/m.184538 type:complete len:175 (+) Transcript_69235:947-1471(+)